MEETPAREVDSFTTVREDDPKGADTRPHLADRMYLFLDEPSIYQVGVTQDDTPQDTRYNFVITAALPKEDAPMDNADFQEYGEKEVLTDIISQIAVGMIREVEEKLPNVVQVPMETTLEDMIMEMLMDDHHRNPIREDMEDFLRSLEASNHLENSLTKTYGSLPPLTPMSKYSWQRKLRSP